MTLCRTALTLAGYFPADVRVTELSVQTTVEYGASPRPVLGSVEAQALGPGFQS